jgi:hypothetical protein
VYFAFAPSLITPFELRLASAVWCLGFGSYLEGLNIIGYNQTGGSSTPGNVGIYDSNSAKNIIGYGLCIIFIGTRAVSLLRCVRLCTLVIGLRYVHCSMPSCACPHHLQRLHCTTADVFHASAPSYDCPTYFACAQHTVLRHAAAAPVLAYQQIADVLPVFAAGIFVNLSVRKPLVIDYKLPYPTGTATGVMINSFFTNGDLAIQQVTVMPASCCARSLVSDSHEHNGSVLCSYGGR